jgi:hypothetical protein
MITRFRIVASLSCLAAWATVALGSQREFVDTYCTECHNATDWAGGVAFDTLTLENIGDEAETWEKAVRKLRGELMPPPGEKQPPQQERTAFVASMETDLDGAAAKAGPHPGHVVLRRLNRSEYANEVREILGVEIDAAALLPQDPESDGFLNVADVLQVSPAFLEQFISAARKVSVRAVGDGAVRNGYTLHQATQNVNQTVHIAGLPLGTRGGVVFEYDFPADGEYEFNIPVTSIGGSLLRAYPTGWLEYRHRLVVTIDEAQVFEGELGGDEDLRDVDQQQQSAVTAVQARFQKIHVKVKAGPRRIGATFVARSLAESDALMQPLMPGLGVDSVPIIGSVEIFGPRQAHGVGDTPSRRKIFICQPAPGTDALPCAREIFSKLARKAFRRPVTDAEVETLLGFYRSGAAEGGFDTGVQKGIMALLSSPKFLYRTELPQSQPRVTELELASRLSFFLWSQGPDDELMRVAEQGKLHDPQVLEAQVRRMLADPRSRSLVQNFAFQWLKLRLVDTLAPDSRLYPNFDEDLRAAFKEELALFVESVLREDRSVLELLDGKQTFVNERLARHYGIPSIRGEQFRRIELTDPRRWGLLGKGAVLLASSYPDRTSPVLRGSWILENIIGTPPAAPPADVDAFPENKEGDAPLTVRERLESHRVNPSCNSCHGVIDPLGLALENFDAIGEWRGRDRFAEGTPIDASGKLAGGTPIVGPVDLRNALLGRPEQFVQTMTEKLMTYALGRTVEYRDMPAVRANVRDAASHDYRFSSMVLGIVKSEQFQLRDTE